jgi:hypothetical protein
VLKLYPIPAKAKSDFICRAFAAGAPKNAEGAVFFGVEGQLEAFQKSKANGTPWYFCDNAYNDKHRGIYFRVTKNALQVDPRGKTSNGKRFAKLGVLVHERRYLGGEMTIVVPQSDSFMKSTIGLKHDWTRETVNTLALMGCPNVHVHPWQRDKIARGEEFAKLLHRARLVVTHSSAAAITALLEGVPAISTSDTAAAHWIGGPFTTEHVLRPQLASVAKRVAFAQILADAQYSMEEFRNGSAWRWLEKN